MTSTPAPHRVSALVHYRLRTGMSQEAVASAVGANRVTVSRWENGSAVPTLVKGLRLAEVLGVDPFELFLGRPRKRIAGGKRR